MAPPDRHGSFANTVIWSCTLLAIAGLTIWKFEIWPIIGLVSETGMLDSKQVASESIAVDPITIARPGDGDESPSVIEPVDSSSDEAPPPAELAKLDIASSLPAIPRPEAPDWNREPPPLPKSDSPQPLNPVRPNRLPTGADFGASGNFPQAKQPPAAPVNQTMPVPTAEPALQPVGEESSAAASSENPFVDTVSATSAADSNLGVDTADFQSESALPADGNPMFAEIDADIAAGRYLAAHRALSKLYWKEPDLRPEIQDRIDKTSTSIYFDPETHYMPAHLAEGGQALAEIAEQYHVPAEYLARLNKLENPAGAPAGRELKVVKGPFGAVIDPDQQTLTLHAHGYYVRKLPCEISLDAPTTETLHVLSEEGETITLGGQTAAGDNPFADESEASTAGTIRLAKEDAAVARDLLVPGSEVTVRK